MDSAAKHPDFIVRQHTPLNGGPPLDLLVRSPVTPSDLFFVRTHGSVPQIQAATYRLSVDGMVGQPHTFTLAELAQMPQTNVTTTIQCAGNRRDELIAIKSIPNETPWGAEAISTAVWRGVLLRDLLAVVGVAPAVRHIAFDGLDDVEKDGHAVGFGGSIPIEWAYSSDVLLALAMNGELLPVLHGYPLRVVVPGYIGARSVKWLGRITAQAEPSQNYFQAHAYKLYPAQSSPETAECDHGIMLGELSVNAVICTPANRATVQAGLIEVAGYAMAGGNRRIERIELSLDDGQTWQSTAILADHQPGVWYIWRTTIVVTPATSIITVRAWNSAANTQPTAPRDVWNFKGYMNNAWHRVAVKVSG